MREPTDDLDADACEQRIARTRERLQSPVCGCGEAKPPGERLCPKCEEWEYQETKRLNPPYHQEM